MERKTNQLNRNRIPIFADLTEDERIYLNVPYMAKGFAKITNCRFDSEKKLWFTGLHNSHLNTLVKLYGVN